MARTRSHGAGVWGRAWPSLALLILFVLAGVETATAGLLARVEPSWSPFYRSPAPAEVANLAAESRQLLTSNPVRVLQILAQAKPREGAAARLLQGLRADAAYQLGGNALHDALRLYRDLAATSPDSAEQAWAQFMGGTIQQGLGLGQEAEIAFAPALAGAPGPWSAALEFNAAVLMLETERYREAGEAFAAWLERHPGAPGRPLALFLAGECAARRSDTDRALALFGEAQRMDSEAWTLRPQTGHLLADLLLTRDQPAGAVQLMEDLAAAAPGTEAASVALLRAGEIWTDHDRVADAARVYGRLLDLGPPPEEGREARLRLALLGVDHADRMELTEPYPAYRLFYRPRPALEEFVAGRDALAAQRALHGLATLERRDGRIPGALALLARVFQEYPESRQSGRAYERYMGLLERYLAEQLAQGAALAVIDQYLVARPAVVWAPTRDIGPVLLSVARAYELLGAPAEARAVYQRARADGTRVLSPERLDERILYTRVLERDPDAQRGWVAGHPGDRLAHLELARTLFREEKFDEAKVFFLRAEKLSKTVGERLEARAQAQRLDAPTATAGVLLEQLQGRRALWSALPDSGEKEAWGAADTLTGARLRFATGDLAGAVRGLADTDALSAADTYLLAVAQLRQGRWADAEPLLLRLAEVDDPVYRTLAEKRLLGVNLARRVRSSQ
ncbi:MAG: hypothetical protein P1P84_17855 [Deferrisomatales bacterium]|nr:hypothetical protein [Deferrisomatales bacterium]